MVMISFMAEDVWGLCGIRKVLQSLFFVYLLFKKAGDTLESRSVCNIYGF